MLTTASRPANLTELSSSLASSTNSRKIAPLVDSRLGKVQYILEYINSNYKKVLQGNQHGDMFYSLNLKPNTNHNSGISVD